MTDYLQYEGKVLIFQGKKKTEEEKGSEYKKKLMFHTGYRNFKRKR